MLHVAVVLWFLVLIGVTEVFNRQIEMLILGAAGVRQACVVVDGVVSSAFVTSLPAVEPFLHRLV